MIDDLGERPRARVTLLPRFEAQAVEGSAGRHQPPPRPSKVTLAVVSGLTLALAGTVGACVTEDNSTQLTVVLTSEAAIPSQVNLLQVEVSSEGSTAGPYVTDLYRQSDGFFPQTLALIPRDEGSVSQPVTVTISAQYQSHDAMGDATGEPTNVVLRSAVASYVEGHTLLLPMPLRMACIDVNCDGVGQSCVGGQCVSATVEPSLLVDYDPRYVFGQNYYQPGASTQPGCFDDATCLASPMPAQVNSDCSFDLPAGAGTSDGVPRVNASVEWNGSPGLIIALDGDDSNEGWTPLPGDPSRGQLSPGVCKALRQQALASLANAMGLYVSVGCPAKSRLLPACDPSLNIGVPLLH